MSDDGLPLGAGLDVTWYYASGPVDPLLVGPLFSDPPLAHDDGDAARGRATYTLGLQASDSRFTVRDFVTVTVERANQAPGGERRPRPDGGAPGDRRSCCPARCRTTACPPGARSRPRGRW